MTTWTERSDPPVTEWIKRHFLFSYYPGNGYGSFSRAHEGTYRDRLEILQEAASGVIRDNHWVEDESGILVRSTLLEPEATNLSHRNTRFDTWSGNTAQASPIDTAVAPDGTTTADELNDTNLPSNALGYLEDLFVVADDSEDHVFSVFIEKKTGSLSIYPALGLVYTGGAELFYILSFAPTSALGAVALGDLSGGTVGEDFGLLNWNDDWMLLWIKGANNGTGNTTLRARVYPAFSTSVGGASDDSLSGGALVAWGPQIEKLDTPTSLIYTPTTSSETRPQDKLTSTPRFNPQELTIWGKLRILQPPRNGTIINIGNETDGITVLLNHQQLIIAYLFKGGTSTSTATNIGYIYGDVLEYRIVYRSNGDFFIAYTLNGGTETVGAVKTGGDLPSLWGEDQISVGRSYDDDNGLSAAHIMGPFVAKGELSRSRLRELAPWP